MESQNLQMESQNESGFFSRVLDNKPYSLWLVSCFLFSVLILASSGMVMFRLNTIDATSLSTSDKQLLNNSKTLNLISFIGTTFIAMFLVYLCYEFLVYDVLNPNLIYIILLFIICVVFFGFMIKVRININKINSSSLSLTDRNKLSVTLIDTVIGINSGLIFIILVYFCYNLYKNYTVLPTFPRY